MRRIGFCIGLLAMNACLMQALASQVTPPPATVSTTVPAPTTTPATASASSPAAAPTPLAPGSRLVASLDPKEDFIILGAEEPEPIEPAKPAMDTAAEIAGGLGIMEPTRLTLKKAPVTVTPGIVPVSPAKTVVLVAGPNIGSTTVKPKVTQVKASPLKPSMSVALNAKVSSMIATHTLPPKPLAAVTPEPASVKVADIKKSTTPVKPATVKVADHQPVMKPLKRTPIKVADIKKSVTPVKPAPVKVAAHQPLVKPYKPLPIKMADLKKLTKPKKLEKPVVVKTLAVKTKPPKFTPKPFTKALANKPPKKTFMPVMHEFASYHPPKNKKVILEKRVLTATVIAKTKKPTKMATAKPMFKPVIKPFVPSHQVTKKSDLKSLMKPHMIT